jgi:hypothetical protein
MARHRRTDVAPLSGRRRLILAAGAAILAAALAGCVAAGLTISGLLARQPAAAPAPGTGQAKPTSDPTPAPHPTPAPRRDRAATAASGNRLAQGLPRPALPPARPQIVRVRGGQITAVGDSVMLASAPVLQRVLPGISIDAVVSRQFYTGVQIVASLASQGLLRPIVVVGLGTNGTVTPDEINQLLAAIGPARRLVLVNTYEARPWEAEVNNVLAATARGRRGVVLANWYTAIQNNTSLLADGIHPGPQGTAIYASVLLAAIRQAASLPG